MSYVDSFTHAAPITDLKLLIKEYHQKQKEHETAKYNITLNNIKKFVDKHLFTKASKKRLIDMAKNGQTNVLLLEIPQDYHPTFAFFGDTSWSSDSQRFVAICNSILPELKERSITLLSPDIELYMIYRYYKIEIHAKVI